MGNVRAANVPKWGNVLAPSGHAACPKLVKNLYKNETFEIRNNQHPPLVYPGLSLDVFYKAAWGYLGFLLKSSAESFAK